MKHRNCAVYTNSFNVISGFQGTSSKTICIKTTLNNIILFTCRLPISQFSGSHCMLSFLNPKYIELFWFVNLIVNMNILKTIY